MFLRSIQRYLATIPFLLLAACSHAEQKVEHPVPAAIAAPKLFTPTVERSKTGGLEVDCILWNPKIKGEVIIAAMHNPVDGQHSLWRVGLPHETYLKAINKILTDGHTIDEEVLGHAGWLAFCGNEPEQYAPPPVKTVSL